MRGITGYGEGNGAYISVHDGFQGQASELMLANNGICALTNSIKWTFLTK